ncbi:MAG: hypothetical protein E7294_10810 [Lachnospiraceae bacterium]|nr:hypothetical protein [Lachnospiraceae bacterium]
MKTMTDCNGKTITYGYDRMGNRVSIGYPGGEVVHYTYYKSGRVKTVTDAQGNVTEYTYDANGNVSQTRRADGSRENYAYNDAGLLERQTDVAADGTILHDFQYTYDSDGNLVQAEGKGQADTAFLTTAEMTYDKNNRLTGYNGQEVLYDDRGNMVHGPLNGRMADFAYDCRNRLVSVTDADGSVTEYEYDAENVRTAKTERDLKTVYLTDRESAYSLVLQETVYAKNLLGIYAKEEEKSTYTYGLGLVSEKKGEETLYYHYNHLGSTTELTKKDGGIKYRFRYGAYGELTDIRDEDGESCITPIVGQTILEALTDALADTGVSFLYNGQYGVVTDTNNLYYMRARYYNPQIKRFINRDVVDGDIMNAKSLNKYSYVQGNPITLTDPFGLSPIGNRPGGPKNTGDIGNDDGKGGGDGKGGKLKDILKRMIPGVGAVCLMKDAADAWKRGDYFGAISCAVGALGNIALTAGLLAMAGAPLAGFAAITGLAATIGAVATSGYAFGNALYYAAEEARTTGSISADTGFNLLRKGGMMLLSVGCGIKYAQTLEAAASVEKTAATGVKESAPVESERGGAISETYNIPVSQECGKFYSMKNANGGNVFVSTEEIGQSDIAEVISTTEGNINLVTGTHGTPYGMGRLEPGFYAKDLERFGSMSNMKIINYAELNDSQLQNLINTKDSTILGWCYSEMCPKIWEIFKQ